MNIARSLSLILASVFSCNGEIFISSTNQVNSLTISSNEALLISAARRPLTNSALRSDIKAYITIAGVDLPFSGTNSIPSLFLAGGEEFAGPVSLLPTYRYDRFPQGEPDGAIFSYYFNEDTIVLPELKLVAGPTGSFGITVEKSTDITHWHPVAVQTTSSDRQAYYRLRITRSTG